MSSYFDKICTNLRCDGFCKLEKEIAAFKKQLEELKEKNSNLLKYSNECVLLKDELKDTKETKIHFITLYQEKSDKLKAELARSAILLEALKCYCDHDTKCILSRWQEGRPSDNGYETMYDNKWYLEKDLPKCTCGLDEAIIERSE